MNTLEKAELTASIPYIAKFLRLWNTDLQFRSPEYGRLKNKKEKKNTGNCKAFYVSSKHKK